TTEPKLNKVLKAEKKQNALEKHIRGTRPLKNSAIVDLLNSVKKMIDGREV
ncbi:9580_t:CDS:1, partial [Gigaspora margarita]